MIVAIMKENECINAALFEDDNLKLAKSLLKQKVWREADAVLELPDGFGIGDKYINGEWIKTEAETE